MTAAAEYPFTMRPLTEAEGGGYRIAFPDLPGCFAFGATVAEAIDAGAEARQSWIEERTAAGRVVPQPRSVTDRPTIREAPWIKDYIERIGKASTRDEWNRCAADAVFKVLFGDPARPGEIVTGNRNPVRSAPGRCLGCGAAEHPHDPLLPFGIESAGHAWLHSRCWRAWADGRKAEAISALAVIGIAAPANLPNDFPLINQSARILRRIPFAA